MSSIDIFDFWHVHPFPHTADVTNTNRATVCSQRPNAAHFAVVNGWTLLSDARYAQIPS